MLNEITIKNIALIDSLNLQFGEGFVVLSGETGAGKSIIIDSISFLLGGKPKSDFIRSGEEQASIEAFFTLTANKAEKVRDLGIEVEEDCAVMLRRSLFADGKSNCLINGKKVSMGIVREIAPYLLELCGQHENQSLVDPKKHIEILDSFCDFGSLKIQLKSELDRLAEIKKQIKNLTGSGDDRETQIDILCFKQKELSGAMLKSGEEAELVRLKKILNDREKAAASATKALELLDESSVGISAADRVSKSLQFIKSLEYPEILSKLEIAYEHLNDVIFSLRKLCSDSEDFDMSIDEIEIRLDLLYRLKRKYSCQSADELMKIEIEIGLKLEQILNSEEEIKKLESEKETVLFKINKSCESISEIRKITALDVKVSVQEILMDLSMSGVRFEVGIEAGIEYSLCGFDKVEFLISANPGEPLKPISKIASGGEMSRIMLALKTVFHDENNIDTIIFDEIDAGISGRTAQKVAEKLAQISKSRQLLCVSHLPQIAAMADENILIEKCVSDGKTYTTAESLPYEKILIEISRLISGAQQTEISIKNAKEIKDMANQFKNNL